MENCCGRALSWLPRFSSAGPNPTSPPGATASCIWIVWSGTRITRRWPAESRYRCCGVSRCAAWERSFGSLTACSGRPCGTPTGWNSGRSLRAESPRRASPPRSGRTGWRRVWSPPRRTTGSGSTSSRGPRTRPRARWRSFCAPIGPSHSG